MSSTLATRCMAAYAATLFSARYLERPNLSNTIQSLPQELCDKFRFLHQHCMKYDVRVTTIVGSNRIIEFACVYQNPRIGFIKKLYPNKNLISEHDI